jgi:hypothetical protein
VVGKELGRRAIRFRAPQLLFSKFLEPSPANGAPRLQLNNIDSGAFFELKSKRSLLSRGRDCGRSPPPVTDALHQVILVCPVQQIADGNFYRLNSQ